MPEEKEEEEKYTFSCEEPNCGFQSFDWSTKKLANIRGAEHKAEHKSGEPMRELVDYVNEVGQ